MASGRHRKEREGTDDIDLVVTMKTVMGLMMAFQAVVKWLAKMTRNTIITTMVGTDNFDCDR